MMRPVDIVLLVAVSAWESRKLTQKELSAELGVSQSSVSRAVRRLRDARLIWWGGALRCMRGNATEFLSGGMKYIFPAGAPGEVTHGLATALSALPLAEVLISEQGYVWPAEWGKDRGLGITPIHPLIPAIANRHPELHEWFALIDGLRIGGARMTKFASDFLAERLELGINWRNDS